MLDVLGDWIRSQAAPEAHDARVKAAETKDGEQGNEVPSHRQPV